MTDEKEMSWFFKTMERTPMSSRKRELPPSSDLWDLVLDMNWRRVVEHAKEYPRDAEWQDGHWHESPLYLACQQNAPAQVVRAIIQAYPDAVLTPSRAHRDLPLHIACRYQSELSVIEELVRDFPVGAVEQTRYGRTPIMALWQFRPDDALYDETFWKKILCILSAVAKFREEDDFLAQKPKTRCKDFRLSYRRSDGGQKENCEKQASPCLVHAAVSLGALSCPLEVLSYVLEEFPDQIKQKDRWGQLPLHVAIGPTSWSSSTRRKYRPREKKFITLLLQKYPEAASTRLACGSQRHPLHLAIANRHTWYGGVEELFLAAPEVLMMTDPVTKLHPFQLAAVPVGTTMVELDTIYMLLRSQPDVLKDYSYTAVKISQPKPCGEMMNKSTAAERCPSHLQGTMLGTMTAVLIGSVVGAAFDS